MKRVYLDWASAAPVHPTAARAYERAANMWGNPASPHEEGRAAKEVLEEARRTIALMAGVKSDAVVFTSGATEANGISIRGHVKALGRAPGDVHLLYVPSGHSSTVKAMEALTLEGYDVEPLVLTDEKLDLEAIKLQVKDTTALVAVDLICGETGTRFDTRGLKQVLGPKALLLVDASQAPLVESFERTRLACDLITLDAAKVGGVRGIGVLIASSTVKLSPIIEGGGQERGIRSGTQTPALAAAFARALTEAMKGREAFVLRALTMRTEFIKALSKEIPEVRVNGGKEPAPHIVNLSLPGIDTEYLAALLDADGIAVSTRSACETDSVRSRAVFALTGDEERARRTLRVSFGPSTSSKELETLTKALIRNVRFLKG